MGKGGFDGRTDSCDGTDAVKYGWMREEVMCRRKSKPSDEPDSIEQVARKRYEGKVHLDDMLHEPWCRKMRRPAV